MIQRKLGENLPDSDGELHSGLVSRILAMVESVWSLSSYIFWTWLVINLLKALKTLISILSSLSWLFALIADCIAKVALFCGLHVSRAIRFMCGCCRNKVSLRVSTPTDSRYRKLK